MSEVRRFSRDFDGGQLTKTLALKFERFTKEADIDGITSFNNKLKACAETLREKVKIVSLNFTIPHWGSHLIETPGNKIT